MSLHDKYALIPGASRPIGRAIAKNLLKLVPHLSYLFLTGPNQFQKWKKTSQSLD